MIYLLKKILKKILIKKLIVYVKKINYMLILKNILKQLGLIILKKDL